MIGLTPEVLSCLAQLGEGLDDGLLLADRHGRVHLSNRAARELLDLEGEPATLGAAGQWQAELLELLQRLPTEGAATEIHVSGPAALILDGYAVEQDDEFWGGIFVARSRADRRRESEGREESRSADFGHEVKNALHSLLLNTYMLRKWAASQPYVETQTLAKFDLVSNEIHRLNGLAEEFMPAARVRIRRESVRLSPLLTEVVAQITPQAEDAGVVIRTRLPGDLPSLHGDGQLLTEAFVALLEDRLSALPRGGELDVLAGVGGKHALVVVIDNAAELSHAGREAGHSEGYGDRSSRGGRGPGVTEWVVRGHGGSFETFDAAGVGTTSLVRLPLPGAAPAVAEPDLGLLPPGLVS